MIINDRLETMNDIIMVVNQLLEENDLEHTDENIESLEDWMHPNDIKKYITWYYERQRDCYRSAVLSQVNHMYYENLVKVMDTLTEVFQVSPQYVEDLKKEVKTLY